MPPRIDISDKLVHFTGGDSDASAFANLSSILAQRAIRGSNRLIKGEYVCVCFTEAPIAAVAQGFVNQNDYSRYRMFGILFSKKHIFGLGGRPAIYQNNDEFDGLPEVCRWRHVRYEPDAEPPIDFTWEREWRILASHVAVEPDRAVVVLPTDAWLQRLVDAHDAAQDSLVEDYSLIMDSDLAQQYREDLPWRVCVLPDCRG